MRISWRGEALNLAVVLFIAAVAAYGWMTLPDRVPVHWNVRGEIDRYGSKVESLLFVPALAASFYVLLLLLPRIDPGRANYARFAGTYAFIRTVLLLVLAIVFVSVVLAGAGVAVDVPTVVGLTTGGTFVLFGSVLAKVRPNWFVGIRTPWTLSSARSWTRTHRLGGWLFIAIGVVLAASILARSPIAIALGVAFSIAATTWLLVYSYLVWRDDPDKVPPAGVLPVDEPRP